MTTPQENPVRRAGRRHDDFVHTAPGTIAGDYLRRYWQPVYHSVDLAPAQAVPLRIMSQDFTLYRSESSAGARTVLVDGLCPHRSTQLSTGWVEGDEIRCFYHGWKFAPDGQCTEQPAEEDDFRRKIAIGGYPTREYLGLVFAYLGPGEPPEFPLYPEFERFDGLVELDSYSRECNYFQNLENALDMSHVGFVHGDNRVAHAGIGHGRRLDADESDWGITYTYTRQDGQTRTNQFGMPNVFNINALPNDPEIGWQESLFWWTPIDDVRHVQFSIHRVPVTGALAERIHARRVARRSEIDIAHQDVGERILAGRATLAGVDKRRVDIVRLQDDIAQVGQGRIADRDADRLGRSDAGIIMIRKLWTRELAAHREGRPLKPWRRTAAIVPRAWGLDRAEDTQLGARGISDTARATIVDVRPFIAIERQLQALHGRGGPGDLYR